MPDTDTPDLIEALKADEAAVLNLALGVTDDKDHEVFAAAVVLLSSRALGLTAEQIAERYGGASPYLTLSLIRKHLFTAQVFQIDGQPWLANGEESGASLLLDAMVTIGHCLRSYDDQGEVLYQLSALAHYGNPIGAAKSYHWQVVRQMRKTFGVSHREAMDMFTAARRSFSVKSTG